MTAATQRIDALDSEETLRRMKQAPSAAESELDTLMARAISGDTSAYEVLLRDLSSRLRSFFRARLSRRDADAEDLVQDTLLAIHQRRSSFDANQPFAAWVYAIARYKLIDYLRREGIRIHVPIDEVAELFARERTDAGDAARDVAALMTHLPEQQRLAVRLTKLEEKSTTEAAASSGMSETSIRVNAHRGVKRLIALIRRSENP
jgi:RNA polymerase sigma-70 factor, ECF subfamily